MAARISAELMPHSSWPAAPEPCLKFAFVSDAEIDLAPVQQQLPFGHAAQPSGSGSVLDAPAYGLSRPVRDRAARQRHRVAPLALFSGRTLL